MKQLLVLLLFPCLALAQYQGNGNQKITLGEQTSADGLVWRGNAAADTTRKPSVDTMAYILLDTNTNIIWQYKKTVNNAWTRVGGSISSGLTGVLPVANGGTNTSTAFTTGSVVFAGASGTYTQDNSNFFWNNSTKKLGIGANSSNLISTDAVGVGDVQLQKTTFSTYQMIGFANNADAGGYMTMYKSRGQSYSNPSIPLSGDNIGQFTFGTFTNSINTNPWRISANIIGQVDGDVDTTSNPGRVVFQTTTIGSRFPSFKMVVKNSGNVGIGVFLPTAVLHLKAGTATASTAPLKFTSGTNLTTAEAGAMEFNGTNLLFTPSTTRHTVNHGLTGSATLDFPSTTTLLSADLTITVTGAADGDVVSLGVPNAAVNANTCYTAWVSAANTVTVRFNNYSSGTINPASGTFKVFVTK